MEQKVPDMLNETLADKAAYRAIQFIIIQNEEYYGQSKNLPDKNKLL